jgi:hypothetical protein
MMKEARGEEVYSMELYGYLMKAELRRQRCRRTEIKNGHRRNTRVRATSGYECNKRVEVTDEHGNNKRVGALTDMHYALAGFETSRKNYFN